MKVVVSGITRAGSSLMMRIVESMNFKIIGHEESKQTPQSFNPKGFWDLHIEEYQTIRDNFPDRSVVKLWSDFGQFVDTKDVRVIVCLRNIDDSVESAMKMFDASEPIEGINYPKGYDETLDFQRNLLAACMDRVLIDNLPVLIVRLDELKAEPYLGVKKIMRFLGRRNETSAIDKAIKSICK